MRAFHGLALVMLLFAGLPSVLRAEAQGNADAASKAKGACVVELFTSEGCSSCPPAEEALQRIAKQAADQQLPVFVLAYHVDIWDRLGWEDRFAGKQASDRMRTYLDGRGLTPLFVIHGKPTPGNGQKVNAAMMKALQEPDAVQVALQAQLDSRHVTVDYALQGDVPAGGVLVVALVERNVGSHVLTGENTGLKLKHWNVVREFQTRKSPKSKGRVKLPIPSDVDRKQASIIAYVQQGEKGPVLGAARHDFAPVAFPAAPDPVEPVAASKALPEALASEYLAVRHPRDWKAQAQAAQATLVGPRKTVLRIQPIPVMRKRKARDVDDAVKMLKKHILKGAKLKGKPQGTSVGPEDLEAQRLRFVVKKRQQMEIEATVLLSPAGVPYMAAIFSQDADADFSVAREILNTLRF